MINAARASPSHLTVAGLHLVSPPYHIPYCAIVQIGSLVLSVKTGPCPVGQDRAFLFVLLTEKGRPGTVKLAPLF